MIWVKRFLPFVIIIAVFFIYKAYNEKKLSQFQEIEEIYASVTAQLWVATAIYRADSEKYTDFRDSLITANNLNKDSLTAFIDKYATSSDNIGSFTKKVKQKVDSIVKSESEIYQTDTTIADSTIETENKEIIK